MSLHFFTTFYRPSLTRYIARCYCKFLHLHTYLCTKICVCMQMCVLLILRVYFQVGQCSLPYVDWSMIHSSVRPLLYTDLYVDIIILYIHMYIHIFIICILVLTSMLASLVGTIGQRAKNRLNRLISFYRWL